MIPVAPLQVSPLQFVINGIVFSSIIVLAAIGLSLVYSIANFANFAHGDMLTVGAFVALATVIGLTAPSEAWLFGAPLWAFLAVGAFVVAATLAWVLVPRVSVALGGGVAGAVLTAAVALSGIATVQVVSLPLWLFFALVGGMAGAAFVAVVTERIVYEPLDAGSIELLITSIGVALTYRALVFVLAGSDAARYGVQRAGPIPVIRDTLGVSVTPRNLVVVASAVVLVGGLHVLLQYTTLGRKMRATADNADLARVAGIRTRRVVFAMWIIGGALAAAGGVFLGLEELVRPRMGFDILLVVFAAVILGGIGSVYGAMLGGFVIGMVHELVPLFSAWGFPVGVEYQAAVAFLIMVAILLVRPEGIMGGEAS